MVKIFFLFPFSTSLLRLLSIPPHYQSTSSIAIHHHITFKLSGYQWLPPPVKLEMNLGSQTSTSSTVAINLLQLSYQSSPKFCNVPAFDQGAEMLNEM
jgi:hypothetical protein